MPPVEHFHIMGSQKSSLKGSQKLGKRDVRVLLNQFHKERQEDFQPAAAFTRPRSQRLKGLATPDLPAPTRRSLLPAAAAQRP